ncbi:MAG TPA: glycoside hydrolase family 3 N-terminal domain-containing protein [Gemmatimonadaceae bacterium]|nr:glycoside hydrolase family 3 N-terminal domain-containing protein [Gemmatimonadaceae bacterium]
MRELAELLVPAIRWDPARGYDGARGLIDKALELGVGGFILFGGEQEAVRSLTKELRSRSRVPLLIGADLERGAGQQFAGATGLPPLAAIAALDDVDAVRRAARLTAREARTMGVNWDFAPVCDLDVVPDNPIVGTRSLGADPKRVGMLAAEWIDSCQSEGVIACAKHFPGHGRTTTDSHVALPVVRSSKKELLETDLLPFKAAIEAGVASVMTAHVAFPSLDPSGLPATMSRDILQWLLRQQLRFDGLVVTDALIMEGAKAGHETDPAVLALNAGCDVLLYPTDLGATARSLEQSLKDGALDVERVHQARRRRLKWAQWASPPNEYRKPSVADAAWGAQLADRVVHLVRGRVPRLVSPVDVILVDDDVGGPYPPPSREPFLRALTAVGIEARHAEAPSREGRHSTVIALFGDIRGWKSRPGYSAETRASVERICTTDRNAVVVQFSHPRLAREISACPVVVCAWGGEAAMQQAAARFLARGG